MKNKKPKTVFQSGEIPTEKISASIANHQSKTTIRAHSIFLGQVSAFSPDGNEIKQAEYSSDTEKSEELFHEIREKAFDKYDLTCMHIHHSLGSVEVGKLYFFVFTSSADQEQATAACDFLVQEIKERIAINVKYS